MARLPARCSEATPEGLSFGLPSVKDFMCWVESGPLNRLAQKEIFLSAPATLMALSNYGQKTSRRRGNCYNLKGLRFTRRTLPGSHRTRLVRAHLGGRLTGVGCSDVWSENQDSDSASAPTPWVWVAVGRSCDVDPCSSRKEGPLTRAARRPKELEESRGAWHWPDPHTRGHGELFGRHAIQPDEGCDFDFRPRSGSLSIQRFTNRNCSGKARRAVPPTILYSFFWPYEWRISSA
jgi:hypothetical protein